MSALSIYALKPRFQALLRPLAVALARSGVSANQVTLAAAVVSVALGAYVAWRAPESTPFLWIPVWMFLRMALNALDGMLAREFGQKSRLGVWVGFGGALPAWSAWLMPLVAALLIVTIVNRVRRGLEEGAAR